MIEKRVSTKEAFKKKEVVVAGWVQDFRPLAKIKFIILRDSSGTLQITIPKANKLFDIEITKESVIIASGKMVPNKEARGGKELIPDKIEILSKAEQPVPIDISGKIKTDLSKRLDWRVIDLRRPEAKAVFKIQSDISKYFREYFIEKGYIEIWTPGIIVAASEGGTELFPVDYMDKKAFLAQSPQLYKQIAVVGGLEKVFMIVPVWRAEPHDTYKHLNESRQMDIEISFANQKDATSILADLMKYIVKNVKKNNSNELKLIGRDLQDLKVKNTTYSEAVEALKKKGLNIKFGDDISTEGEKMLSKMYGEETLIITHDWPSKLKPFYIMPKQGTELSEGFDAVYNSIELVSGGQRVHLPDILIKQLEERKLNPKDFKFYIDTFRYGAMPHSGWSIGLERLTMTICGLSNIRDATLFPRDRERLTP